MNKKVTFSLIIFLFILFIAFPVFAAPQWYKVRSGSQILLHCHFINTQEGWAVGYGNTVLKTIDGGINWSTVEVTVPSGSYFSSVFFFDRFNGWLAHDSGRVFHTTDAGSTWTAAQVTSNPIFDVVFVDSLNGFAGSNGGSLGPLGANLWKSADGGATWTNNATPPMGATNSISFLMSNKQYGAMVGATVAAFTIDGGNGWPTRIPSGSPQSLNQVVTVAIDTAYAVGNGGYYCQTTDHGQNWVQNLTPGKIGKPGDLLGISFIDKLNGWVVGTGDAYSITNGVWSVVNLPDRQNNQIAGVYAIDANHAWMVGGSGYIYVYTDTPPPLPPVPSFPSSVEVTVINSTESVGLSWTAASGASSYQVYRSKKSEGTTKLSDDFNGPTLDLTKWSTTESVGSFDILLNGGRLEVSGTAAPSGGDFGYAGVYGRNIFANTAKLIEISADVDLSHGTGFPVFGSPCVFLASSNSGIVPYLEKVSATQYTLGCLLGGNPNPTNLDTAPNSAGNLKMLQVGNYASIFFNGTYKGKIPSNLSSVSGLNYMLLGFTSKSVSMDVFFDNFKAVEYPLTLLTNASAPTTSYIDTSVVTGETYFYTVIPVNSSGNSSGSNVVEVTIAGPPPGPPSAITGVVSIQGGEISLTIKSNSPITVSSSAAGGTPVSITVFGTGWSDKLDSSSATSIQQNQAGDITVKWTAGGKIAQLDKGIYPTMLRVGNITQKIYLVKY